jgi:hypothetical protein
MESYTKNLLENRKNEVIKELKNPLYWLFFRHQLKSELELIEILLKNKKL